MTTTTLMMKLLDQHNTHPTSVGSEENDAFWTVMNWLRKIGESSAPDKSCAFCDGTGITTENHPYARIGAQCGCRFGAYEP